MGFKALLRRLCFVFAIGMGIDSIIISNSLAVDLSNQYYDNDLIKMGFPDYEAQSFTGQDLVTSYLTANHASFGFAEDLSNLKFVEKKKSLTGFHYLYEQLSGDFTIENANIAVTTNLDETQIVKVYSTIDSSAPLEPAPKRKLSKEIAYDLAWNHLRVHGRLFEQPNSKILFKRFGNDYQLIRRVEISTVKPYGSWVVEINAETGKILKVFDQRKTRKNIVPQRFDVFKGPVIDRQEAFREFFSHQKVSLRDITEVADANTKVFDPDPRTSLNNDSLEDDSAPEEFSDAYVDRVLKDISFDGTNYFLKGPWVSVIDFDPPNTPPTQQTTSEWIFERGSIGFNEAMTYFHIDQNQRYMQSLGFKDDTGILNQSIEVDADGANGDDNSFFQPSTNRLSFGHGCVDDNEDADVILHEYGHAIQHFITNDWFGGDTGAIGEGFGDYWAASYSISTDTGANFEPYRVFHWDGHGLNSSCWSGRILNAFDARYDHARNYSAHITIDGGFVSDELWSTPLFQALQDLIALGHPREEVDKIILQSHYGLGSNVKMRDMALSTIQAAQTLFPDGPHADVFYNNFLRHDIIVVPSPRLSASNLAGKDSTGSEVFNPGDNVLIDLDIENNGDLGAEKVTVVASSPLDTITFVQDTIEIEFIEFGEKTTIEAGFAFDISPDAPCGLKVPIDLVLSASNGKESNMRFYLTVGKPIGVSQSISPSIAIPDNEDAGIMSSLEITDTEERTVSENLKLSLEVEHTYIGDLQISLISPDGTTVLVHDREGGNNDDIVETYPTTKIPAESFEALVGKSLNGTWQLKVVDYAAQDVGTILQWGLEDIVEYQCTQSE